VNVQTKPSLIVRVLSSFSGISLINREQVSYGQLAAFSQHDPSWRRITDSCMENVNG